MIMLKGNIIDKLEKLLCRILESNILPQESYLAGGTAVYFYLNHRVSVDLDFFSPKSFNPDIFIYNMKKYFDNVYVELLEQNSIILFISKDKIKFSLFFFPYALLQKTQSFVFQKNLACPLASLKDIEAMKAVAISQRGSAKDFIDLYFLLKKTGHRFDDILKYVKKKYEVKSDYEYQLRTSFVYFDDAEKGINAITMVKKKDENDKIKGQEWKKIKSFFIDYIK
jgi:predicted nucleotidyltransferase component of viral defense system